MSLGRAIFDGAPTRGSSEIEEEHRAVLLVNIGSPDSLRRSDMRRYLSTFLGDPRVIQMPKALAWGHGALARLIAAARASRTRRMYQSIWTDRGSPLRIYSEDQARAVQESMPKGWRVFLAMRYGRPSIETALTEVAAAGIDDLVVVPMFPQFSETTTGTIIEELHRVLRKVGPHINVSIRASWFDDFEYVESQALRIAEFAIEHGLRPEHSYLLFSSHGLPVSYTRRGDHYGRQIERTVALVAERLGWPGDRWSIAFQSRFGPYEWLRPYTEDELARLGQEGERKVLVCPISYAADCLETLHEIGIRYRAAFESLGDRLYVCPAMNAFPPFINALKHVALRGSQPRPPREKRNWPLLNTDSASSLESRPHSADSSSLIMIGVSLPGRLNTDQGPRLSHASPSDFAAVKKSQEQVETTLRTLRGDDEVLEAWVWNTCHRFEFYGWIRDIEDVADRECIVARMRQLWFGDEPANLKVNVLLGADSRHHLIRSAVGMNSGLPGDCDVAGQLEAAVRLAERSGTVGAQARQLMEEVSECVDAVRRETEWGRHAMGYCDAVLDRVLDSGTLDVKALRFAVFGGSSTSCSVIQALIHRFGVSEPQIALVYRGHGTGQVKRLRKVLPHGRRVRVHQYDERAAMDAIAESDFTIFGLDRTSPVIRTESIRSLRDWTRRPLTVIDFNTFGSLEDIERVDGLAVFDAAALDREVAALAAQRSSNPGFRKAVEEAEGWILRHLSGKDDVRRILPCDYIARADDSMCSRCGVTCDAKQNETVTS